MHSVKADHSKLDVVLGKKNMITCIISDMQSNHHKNSLRTSLTFFAAHAGIVQGMGLVMGRGMCAHKDEFTSKSFCLHFNTLDLKPSPQVTEHCKIEYTGFARDVHKEVLINIWVDQSNGLRK